MDERELAEEIKELLESAMRLGLPPFVEATIDYPKGEAAGCVLTYPEGVFLVTVTQIGD